jgi:hypothetical protein
MPNASKTVESVFGIIKNAMGFRRFHLRGIVHVATEWLLIALAYNYRQMIPLQSPFPPPPEGRLAPPNAFELNPSRNLNPTDGWTAASGFDAIMRVVSTGNKGAAHDEH